MPEVNEGHTGLL